MADKHFDEVEVSETTPQGTQEQGVAQGHDERDVNLRAIMGWFAGLAVLTVVTYVVIWGMFVLLANREKAKDVMPSPLFVSRRQPPPPAPRLLPTPWEAHAKERQSENERLAKIGLLDPKTGLPTIPASAMNVGNQPAPAAPGSRTSGAAGMSGTGSGAGASQGTGQGSGMAGQMPRPLLPRDWSGGRTMELREQ